MGLKSLSFFILLLHQLPDTEGASFEGERPGCAGLYCLVIPTKNQKLNMSTLAIATEPCQRVVYGMTTVRDMNGEFTIKAATNQDQPTHSTAGNFDLFRRLNSSAELLLGIRLTSMHSFLSSSHSRALLADTQLTEARHLHFDGLFLETDRDFIAETRFVRFFEDLSDSNLTMPVTLAVPNALLPYFVKKVEDAQPFVAAIYLINEQSVNRPEWIKKSIAPTNASTFNETIRYHARNLVLKGIPAKKIIIGLTEGQIFDKAGLVTGLGGIGAEWMDVDMKELRAISDRMQCSDGSRQSMCTRLCFISAEKPLEKLDPAACSHVVAEADLTAIGTVSLTSMGVANVKWIHSLPTANRPLLLIDLGARQPTWLWRQVLSVPAFRDAAINQLLQIMKENAASGVVFSWYMDSLNLPYDAVPLNSLLFHFRQSDSKCVVALGASHSGIYFHMHDLNRTADLVILRTDILHDPNTLFTGHPSPLYNSSIMPDPSKAVESVVSQWLSRGYPRSKIVMGISAQPLTMSLLVPDRADNSPFGMLAVPTSEWARSNNDKLATSGQKVCETMNDSSTRLAYNDEFSVPFLVTGTEFVAFEDERSISEKMKFSRIHQLAGVALFHVELDNPNGACPSHPFPILKTIRNHQVCGLVTRTEVEGLNTMEMGGMERVLGGHEASSVNGHKTIVQVLAKEDGKVSFHACGGTIIDKRYVLTAAHCVKQPQRSFTVVTGSHRHGHGKSHKVVKFTIHPDYDKDPLRKIPQPNDIAVLEIDPPVTTSDLVDVEPFNPRNSSPTEDCTIQGWGVIAWDGEKPIFPQFLQETSITPISDDVCEKDMAGSIKYKRNTTICARHPEGTAGPCMGDSGGPLRCRYGDQMVYQGVASWVTDEKCAPQFRSYFVRLNSFVGWINKVTELKFAVNYD